MAEAVDGARARDPVVVRTGTDTVPRPVFDRMLPGDRLVVPLRLSPVVGWLQPMVTLRKVPRGFDQVAIAEAALSAGWAPAPEVVAPSRGAAGGRRRPASDRARGRPARLQAGEVADAVTGSPLLDVSGPALAGLDRAGRQRLAVTALGFGRHRPLSLGGASALGLVAYVALGLPEQRLVTVTRAGGPSGSAHGALGVVDAVDGSLALLALAAPPVSHAAAAAGTPDLGVRLDAYGARGAERALLSAVDRWRLAGRPRLTDATVGVRYGAVRPHAWHSARRGDQWITLDWTRPGGAGR